MTFGHEGSYAFNEDQRGGHHPAVEKAVDEAVKHKFETLEAYIKEYLRLTGAKIEELVLCERRDGLTTHYWLQPKSYIERITP